jgi:flagellar biosynthesis protein FliQ
MTPDLVVAMLRQMLLTTLWIAAPLLLIGLAAGIVISLLQIVTSIQDAAFNAIPRLAVFVTSALLLMPWMVRKLMDYTIVLFADLGRYAR